MIARNRETIPPLPAEGRTSMDLPRDAERDFYATIGYLPLGDHAIRADMVERLAAMARQAVRESRETARRAQQAEKKQAQSAPAASADAAVASATESGTNEISEWAIVAAAFGENEPQAELVPEPTPAPALEPAPPPLPGRSETARAAPRPWPATRARRLPRTTDSRWSRR